MNGLRDDWTAQRTVQVLPGTCYAAIHRPYLTAVYAVEDLCEHPDFVEPIGRDLAPYLGFM